MQSKRIDAGELLISLALLALGSFVVFETQGIAETQGYSQVGPRLFPYLIGTGLTLCGTWLAWQALSGGWRAMPDEAETHAAPDRMGFLLISAGVVLHMVLIGWAGFILASTLLFVLVARGFGSTKPVRDVAIAAVLSTIVYFLFTQALGLSLPAGLFGG
ncbi:tripartite tricarboxylate transporter TctB family protein [Aromatoleum petrolei]|uniref:Tripartite tricarboxylate transporter TctB family protein n=1 Tax=Aromatoleum petrolei TaxID=76116 RepID=A0ABX1MP77_9RHOO|nr:tripartite tricarboxylate transporter TctB family protein [Aromatoleum petrolei]NMF87929.1 tripartite tricarboxylate transporter TctB family protein [Aromatoleum petrolei]QTQ36703.1 Putative tricarboxylic transport membrane protein [Aromatoleum petrolei]